jgi:hypothetical protein
MLIKRSNIQTQISDYWYQTIGIKLSVSDYRYRTCNGIRVALDGGLQGRLSHVPDLHRVVDPSRDHLQCRPQVFSWKRICSKILPKIHKSTLCGVRIWPGGGGGGGVRCNRTLDPPLGHYPSKG